MPLFLAHSQKQDSRLESPRETTGPPPKPGCCITAWFHYAQKMRVRWDKGKPRGDKQQKKPMPRFPQKIEPSQLNHLCWCFIFFVVLEAFTVHAPHTATREKRGMAAAVFRTGVYEGIDTCRRHAYTFTISRMQSGKRISNNVRGKSSRRGKYSHFVSRHVAHMLQSCILGSKKGQKLMGGETDEGKSF